MSVTLASMRTATVTTADGKQARITSARAVAWHAGDEQNELEGAEIVGRAVVDIEGGGQLHGLLVETVDDAGDPDVAVVWWDRYTSRFVVTSIDGSGG